MPRARRLALLADAYRAVSSFEPADRDLPMSLFGVVVDARFRTADSQADRERLADEVLLDEFDSLLMRARLGRGKPNPGLVVHDRRLVVERDIQAWTAGWR